MLKLNRWLLWGVQVVIIAWEARPYANVLGDLAQIAALTWVHPDWYVLAACIGAAVFVPVMGIAMWWPRALQYRETLNLLTIIALVAVGTLLVWDRGLARSWLPQFVYLGWFGLRVNRIVVTKTAE